MMNRPVNLCHVFTSTYSRVPNISVVPINSVGGGKFPKFNNSVGVFTYVMYCLIIVQVGCNQPKINNSAALVFGTPE